MTLKLILAFVIAFAVSAVVGFFLVPYLKRIKAGQSIKENGPTWHMSKQGTPTMGGLMFIAAIAVVCLSVGFDCMAEGEYGHLFCLAFALVFGAIGFLDDYEKLKKKQNLGLTAGKKLLLQLAAAVAFIFLMRRFGYVALDSLYIPFWNKTVPVSEPLYVIFAAFVIVGTVKFFLIYRVKMNICDKKIPVYDHFLYGVQRIPEQLLFLLPESICHFHRHLLPVQGRKCNHLFCFPSTGCAFPIRQLLSTEHAISFFIVPVCKNSHDSSSFLFFSFLFF